ncbi:TonB family protein [Nitrospirillum amazonense]|uniref:TonB family protein n=1 Tax=Nitrospirillum amazonense TaxID=28077 RepID=A0A560FMG1_9PROT|nr:energy transducer TonB [Nitrospirillum amazonense]TWB22808.1 TonB family protein [Nitrospirillum amazonense]
MKIVYHRLRALALSAICLAPLFPAVAQDKPPPDPTRSRLDVTSFRQPDYPMASSRLGEQGRVGISVDCAVDGRVSDPKVTESSGFERLDNAVLAIIPGLRCFPGHDPASGKPIAGSVLFRYNFKLGPPAPSTSGLQLSRDNVRELLDIARAANPGLTIPEPVDSESRKAVWDLALNAKLTPEASRKPQDYPTAAAGPLQQLMSLSIAFFCSAEGRVTSVRVFNSSGNPKLDAAMADALPLQTACQPTTGPDHRPLASWGFIIHTFIPPPSSKP